MKRVTALHTLGTFPEALGSQRCTAKPRPCCRRSPRRCPSCCAPHRRTDPPHPDLPPSAAQPVLHPSANAPKLGSSERVRKWCNVITPTHEAHERPLSVSFLTVRVPATGSLFPQYLWLGWQSPGLARVCRQRARSCALPSARQLSWPWAVCGIYPCSWLCAERQIFVGGRFKGV